MIPEEEGGSSIDSNHRGVDGADDGHDLLRGCPSTRRSQGTTILGRGMKWRR
jgi:hypothetical protein